jgi:cytochrome b561
LVGTRSQPRFTWSDHLMTTRFAAESTRIAAGDDPARYDGLAMTLHWVTAVLVVLLFMLAESWEFVAKPIRQEMIVAHMSFGVLFTLVLAVRIAWRVTPAHHVQDATTGIVELASRAVHYLLYVLLVAQAVLGFVWRWSGNEAIGFFGLLIPPPFAPFSKPAHAFVADAHNWIGWTIIILAGGHAAAALFHQFVLRDDVLWRMMPGLAARRAEPRASDARVVSKEVEGCD